MFQILLAEDNPGDVLLFREALKSQGVPCDVVVAEDGQKAIALLRNAAVDAAGFRPHLIVLDVNLPKQNGDAVLRHLRHQSIFKDVPVIMLTSSPSPAECAAALELGANMYLQKSSDLDELLDIGRIVEGVLSNGGSHPEPRA